METMSTLPRTGPLMPPPLAKVPRPKSVDGSHTRPIRSSPLAGPALNRSPPAFTTSMSSDDPVEESLMITTPPICHVHPKSGQNFDFLALPEACSSPPTTLRRKSITTSSNRPQSLYVPSTSDSGHAPRTTAAEWEIDPLQCLSTSRTPLRPRPSSGMPSFRLPIPIVEEEPDWQAELDAAESSSKGTSRNSSTSEFTPPRSISQPQVNSWYTANPYDVTPRFSRLGLSASTVVMPLSSKEHRRLSKNSSLARTNSTSSTSTATPTKRFFIPSLTSKSSPPTRASLQPPQQQKALSRTLSTASSSETSSLASNSQCETTTPTSTSASASSLTRSKGSEDSISTWYESFPPTTPHVERDMTLPTKNDGEECDRDKKEVNGGMGGIGSHDRNHDHPQFHYSDITITIQHDSENGKTLPDPHAQSQQPQLTLTPPTPPTPQPTNISPQTPAFPKDVKKVRGSLRKKLTMTTLTMMTPLTTPIRRATDVGKVAVGLPEVPVPVVLPPTLSIPTAKVTNSKDTWLSASSISLPMPTAKKRRPTFRSVLRSLIARW